MKEIIKPSKTTYFIASDPAIHYGKVKTNQSMGTGQKELETFTTELSMIKKLKKLGVGTIR